MNRSETLPLSEVFKRMLEEEPDIHEHLLEAKALSLLPTIFGPMYRYIGSCQIQNGILFVEIFSGAVKQAILLDKATLLSRINQEIGAELLRDLEILNKTKIR